MTDTTLTLAHIAYNQVFSHEFHLFGIRHGKSWKFERDDVAEIISDHQWIYRGNIGPDRLVDLGRWKAVPPLDQFEPYPEGTDMELNHVPEPDRTRILNQRKHGMWPTGALAYLEPHNQTTGD